MFEIFDIKKQKVTFATCKRGIATDIIIEKEAVTANKIAQKNIQKISA